MSLYNMVLGMHPFAGDLLRVLGFTPQDVDRIARIRDVYLYPEEIRILTRTGGGNREEYEGENEWLRGISGFLRDWDDSYDSTFAWWAYRWPDEQREALQTALERIQEHRPDLLPDHLGDRFEEAISKMKQGSLEKD